MSVTARVRRAGGVRRGLVFVAAALVVVMVVLSLTRDEANTRWPWWVAFGGFALVWFAARFASGNVAEGRADRLDERDHWRSVRRSPKYPRLT